jgi:hypothetical protein
MKFVGLDPGVSGGGGRIWTDDNLAIIGYDVFAFEKMTPWDITNTLRQFATGDGHDAPRPVVLIEKQGTRPTDSRPGVAKLHHQCGMLHGILYGLGIAFEDLPPATWQKMFKLLMPKGTSSTVKKNKHKAVAQRLFPEIKMTHAISDGLLIAEYGRRMYRKGVACG